jgi:hypothetical protein
MVKSVLIENVLLGEDHLEFEQYLKTMQYYPVDLGDDTMFAGELPPGMAKTLEDKISEHWGTPLEAIATFARINDENLDFRFRVHSDGIIQGEQPTVAAVYYIESGGSGTALMSHPDHGECGVGIFTEDDGNWELESFFPGESNSLAIYNADAFHTRYPHQAMDTRVVVVSFLKEKKVG